MGDQTDYGPPHLRMRWNESESEFRRRENDWYMQRYEEWWKKRQRELANGVGPTDERLRRMKAQYSKELKDFSIP